MEEKKIHIHFNENIVRKQLWQYFYYSWKKKLPVHLMNLFYALLAIFIFDSLFSNKSRYDFLRFTTTFLGIAFIVCLINFFYQKANYSNKMNKHIDELKGYHPITEFIFDEESIHIKCEQYDIRSIWGKITYEVSNKMILIHIDMNTIFTYLISEDETDKYAEILEILQRKARQKGK
ncbi:hypothetical protein [Chryseobacterium viscerum]|uniref:YcxB-like protein domain-containing protein n=1 Tax=Chryseobacterium viscerum TaxID=1037377 RepID=A0A316WD78_9FLAO|nr:hypothetical protein [Chryseobacterium viscerum]PWN58959.1 hypothetical protein C1634_020305 [Chryseobacterium viscerum]